MGQYYFPTILRQKGKRFFSEQYYSHDYGNGLKLMEHSYIGNYFVNTVYAQLYNNPGRLAWLGDYHEAGDIKNADLDKAFRRHYKLFHDTYKNGVLVKPKQKNHTQPEMVLCVKGRFILNHDKKCFIDLIEYTHNAPKDEWDCAIHPLPLLTAVGNGRGGGDYWGINQEDVGSWAGDLIETQDAKPNGYTDITDFISFSEER